MLRKERYILLKVLKESKNQLAECKDIPIFFYMGTLAFKQQRWQGKKIEEVSLESFNRKQSKRGNMEKKHLYTTHSTGH